MKSSGSKQQRRYLQKTLDNIAKNDTNTTDVVLNGFPIGDESLAALAMSLINNRHVKSLYLHDIEISTKGIHLLAYALQHNKTLECLSLNDNKIGSVGAEVIAVALYDNQTLKTLSLVNNSIGNHGGKKLSRMLKSNQSIREIFLEGNGISEKILAKIDLHCEKAPLANKSRDEDSEEQDASTYAGSDFTSHVRMRLDSIEEGEDTVPINEISMEDSLDFNDLHSRSFTDGNSNLASYIRGVVEEQKTNTFVDSDGDLASYIKRVTVSIEETERDETTGKEWANGSDLSIAVEHNQVDPKCKRKNVMSKLKSIGWSKSGKSL